MTIKCYDTVDVLNGEHVDGILIESRTGKAYNIVETKDGDFVVTDVNYKPMIKLM